MILNIDNEQKKKSKVWVKKKWDNVELEVRESSGNSESSADEYSIHDDSQQMI